MSQWQRVMPVLGLAAALTAPALMGQTIPTRVMVRVVAHDAKLIGSGVGGARVIIRDVASGRVLAQGEQAGTTGSTERIMVEPRVRHRALYDSPGAAGFLATLALAEPTQVEIVAEGPLGAGHAVQRASKTMLLVPGHDVLGDGVVLELMGFTVVLEDPSDSSGPPSAAQPIGVRVSVTMLCGCPTEPGGLWDADMIDVVARIRRGPEVVAVDTLSYAGTTSTYRGELIAPAAGEYRLEVIAMDPLRGSFGWIHRPLRVNR